MDENKHNLIMVVSCIRMNSNARLPTRGTPGSAGFDLYSCEQVVIPRKKSAIINTGIRFIMQEGYYGRIQPRSGLSIRHGIEVGAGTIDQDYQGIVMVHLHNFGDQDYTVQVRDRIAQIVFMEYYAGEMEESDFESIDSTRGDAGFGSTGR